MKKKVSAPKRSASSVKKTAPKKSRASQGSVVTYQRIVIFSACIVLAVVGGVFMNKPAVTQSVAGVSIAKGLFSQATVELPKINGAVAYNIYYKKTDDNTYTNAVRKIPTSATSYTISYLTRGGKYDYKISAVDASGKEIWFSPTQPLKNIKPM
jgi:fibronectin type 3 domain-containing protein